MRIAVIGAGAVGGYVGGRLAGAGAEVSLLARGANLSALRTEGLAIRSPHGDVRLHPIPATDRPAEIGPTDLVIVAVKLGDLETAAGALAPLLGPDTRVLALQNGIDAPEILARHVAADRVRAGVIYIAAALAAPGVVSTPGGVHRMILQAPPGDGVMAALLELCGRAVALDAEGVDDIRPALWEKFVTLAAFAGVTCLARAPLGIIRAHPETAAFWQALLAENVAVARAEGLAFAEDDVARIVGRFASQPAEMISSMLGDLRAGRPLEVRWLSGRIADLGRRHAIPTPANDAVCAALAPYADGTPAPAAGSS